MSRLHSLKLVVGKRPHHLAPIVRKRNKLSIKIQEQLELYEAHLAGKIYAPRRLNTAINSETGEKCTAVVPKRVKEWHWMTQNGKMNIALKYGASTLGLGMSGAHAIEVENHAQVIDALKLLKMLLMQEN